MRRIKLGICAAIFSMVMFAGCLPDGNSEEQTQITDTAFAEREEITEKQEEGEKAAETASLADYCSGDFVLGEDDPYYFFSGFPITESDKGYYYLTETGYLCFVDKESDANIYVCSKPNCTHSAEQCMAYLENAERGLGIWFCNNWLYFIGCDENNRYDLYRISEDGSVREKVTELFRYGSENVDVAVNVLLHRGRIFYSIKESNGSCVLYARQLQSPDSEDVLYTEEGDGSSIYRIRGYGEGICFEANHRQGEGLDGALYYCDTKTKAVSVIRENIYRDYTIADGKLFYSDDTMVNVVDLDSGESAIFYEAGHSSYISFDGKHIYVDNCTAVMHQEIGMEERCVRIFDLEGTPIDQIEFIGVDPCAFGNADRFFYIQLEKKPTGGYSTHFMMMFKTDPGSVTAERKELLWN